MVANGAENTEEQTTKKPKFEFDADSILMDSVSGEQEPFGSLLEEVEQETAERTKQLRTNLNRLSNESNIATDILTALDVKTLHWTEDGEDVTPEKQETFVKETTNELAGGGGQALLTSLAAEEESRTAAYSLDRSQRQVEQMVETGDVTEIEKPVQQGAFAEQTPQVTLLQGLVERAGKAEEIAQKRVLADQTAELMKMISWGINEDTAKTLVQAGKQYKSADEALTDANLLEIEGKEALGGLDTKYPFMTSIFDALAPGVSMGARTFLGKALGAGGRVAVGKSAEGVSLAAMTAAKEEDVGAFGQFLAGFAAPVAAFGLLSLSKNGARQFLAQTKETNKQMYDNLHRGIREYEGRSADYLKEALDDIDQGRVSLTGEINPHYRQIDDIMEDPAGKVKVGEALEIATKGDDASDTVKAARKSLGVGDKKESAQVAVHPYLGEVIDDKAGLDITNPQTVMDVDGFNLPSGYFNNIVKTSEMFGTASLNKELVDYDDFANTVVATISPQNGIFSRGSGGASMLDSAVKNYRRSNIGTGEKIIQPSIYLKRAAPLLVDFTSNAERQANKATSNLNRIVKKEVFGGLKREEEGELLKYIDMASEAKSDWVKVPGGIALENSKDNVFQVSDKIVERIAKHRIVDDAVYAASNKAMIDQLSTAGAKRYKNFVVAPARSGKFKVDQGKEDIFGVKYTKETSDQYVPMRILSGKGKTDGDDAFILMAKEKADTLDDIPYNMELLPKIKGHSPITYDLKKSKFFVAGMARDASTGKYTVRQIGGAEKNRDATEMVATLNEKAASEGLDEKFFSWRPVNKGSQDQAIEMVLDKGGLTPTASVSDRAGVMKALRQAGFDNDVIDAIDQFSLTQKPHSPSVFKQRTEQGLRDIGEAMQNIRSGTADYTLEDVKQTIANSSKAKALPADKSFEAYAHKAMQFVHTSPLRSKINEEFVTKAKAAGLLAGDKWDSPIISSGLTSKQIKKLNEVQNHQRLLHAINGVPDRDQIITQAKWANRAQRALDKGTVGGKQYGQFIDRYLSEGLGKPISDALTKIGVTAKLGAFNLGMTVVQPAAVLNTVGKYANRPMLLGKATSSFAKALVDGIWLRAKGRQASKESRALAEMIERSGYLTGLNFEYVDQAITKHNFNPSMISKAGSSAMKAGFAPNIAGEALGRGLAFTMEHEMALDQIRKGTHRLFKMSDVGTDAYIQHIESLADQTVGNFTRFNRAYFAQNKYLKVPMQFMQWGAHQSTIALNKSLTPNQRMAIYGANVAALGYAGIPFIETVTGIGEDITSYFEPSTKGKTKRVLDSFGSDLVSFIDEDAPDSVKEFADRQVSQGFISALTEGEVNLATRLSIANIGSSITEGYTLDDLAGPGITTVLGTLDGLIKAPKHYKMLFMDNENFTTEEAAAEFGAGLVKEWTGLHNFISAMRKRGYDNNGRVVFNEEEWNLKQRISEAIGVSTKEKQERYSTMTDYYELRESYENYAKRAAQDIVKMSRGNPESARQEATKHMRVLQDMDLTGNAAKTFSRYIMFFKSVQDDSNMKRMEREYEMMSGGEEQ